MKINIPDVRHGVRATNTNLSFATISPIVCRPPLRHPVSPKSGMQIKRKTVKQSLGTDRNLVVGNFMHKESPPSLIGRSIDEIHF